MRFALGIVLSLLSVRANAVELLCHTSPVSYGQATCSHPKADLVFDEVHIDNPGTYHATVSFSSALKDVMNFTGYRFYHFDIYNAGGVLIDGNDAFDELLINVEIPAGLTGFSFQYTLPEIRSFPTDWFDIGKVETEVQGTSSYFSLESATKLPAFTFNISRVESAVPEPSSWLLMIGGVGLIGATMRRTRRKALSVSPL